MSVNGGVAGSSGEVFAFAVGNVLSVPLNVSLGESEVDEEHFVGGFVEADAEVVGFDVSVEEVAVVDVLDSSDHLIDEHENSFQRELAKGVFEETFEGRAHQVHD